MQNVNAAAVKNRLLAIKLRFASWTVRPLRKVLVTELNKRIAEGGTGGIIEVRFHPCSRLLSGGAHQHGDFCRTALGRLLHTSAVRRVFPSLYRVVQLRFARKIAPTVWQLRAV